MIDFHPAIARRARAARAAAGPATANAPSPRTRAQRREGPLLAVRVGERLDMAELRRLRDVLGARREPGALELDFSGVRGADGDALLLLESDLSRLWGAGIRVALRGISSRLHVQLYLHPIIRFANDIEELFTDPDLDWPGFRASRH